MSFRKTFRVGNRVISVEPVETPSIKQGQSGESIEPEVLPPSSQSGQQNDSQPVPSTRKMWTLGSCKTKR